MNPMLRYRKKKCMNDIQIRNMTSFLLSTCFFFVKYEMYIAII